MGRGTKTCVQTCLVGLFLSLLLLACDVRGGDTDTKTENDAGTSRQPFLGTVIKEWGTYKIDSVQSYVIAHIYAGGWVKAYENHHHHDIVFLNMNSIHVVEVVHPAPEEMPGALKKKISRAYELMKAGKVSEMLRLMLPPSENVDDVINDMLPDTLKKLRTYFALAKSRGMIEKGHGKYEVYFPIYEDKGMKRIRIIFQQIDGEWYMVQ